MDNYASLLLNENDWPSFSNPDSIRRLELLATSALKENTEAGYISSILIYHQISEEIINVLIMDSEYILATQLVSKYSYKVRKRNYKMFGECIKDFKECVEFEQKERILEIALSINKKRIAIVHKIISIESISELQQYANEVKNDFLVIKKLFEKAHETFLIELKKEKDELRWAIDDTIRIEFDKTIDYSRRPRYKIDEIEGKYQEWLAGPGKKISENILNEYLD